MQFSLLRSEKYNYIVYKHEENVTYVPCESRVLYLVWEKSHNDCTDENDSQFMLTYFPTEWTEFAMANKVYFKCECTLDEVE